MIGHNGDLPGFTSVMYYDPERELTVIAYTTLNISPNGQSPILEVMTAITTELYHGPVGADADGPPGTRSR